MERGGLLYFKVSLSSLIFDHYYYHVKVDLKMGALSIGTAD